jgi:hypothetical protein
LLGPIIAQSDFFRTKTGLLKPIGLHFVYNLTSEYFLTWKVLDEAVFPGPTLAAALWPSPDYRRIIGGSGPFKQPFNSFAYRQSRPGQPEPLAPTRYYPGG